MVGKLKREIKGDFENKKLCMKNSVVALITFNVGHQFTIETLCTFGVGSLSMGEKMGLCYVPSLQGSPALAGFHYLNLIVVVLCDTVD